MEVRFDMLWGGLPAHPLFTHVPVILIPVVAVGTLILCGRREWFTRHSVWLCALAVFTLAALHLTMNAGDALRADLELDEVGGQAAALVAQHADAASILRLLTIAFTALLILVLALDRHAHGLRIGISGLDALASRSLRVLGDQRILRFGLVLLALACLYYVVRTGDLGARATWATHLTEHHHH